MTEEHEFREVEDKMPAPHKRGTKIGAYILTRRISKHPVYLALHQQTRQKVVIKQAVPYNRGDGSNPIKIGNLCLLYEADLQKRCEHPNVCPVADIFAHDGATYLATPRLGKSLAQRIEKGLSQLEKLLILQGTAKALAQCHSKGVVHLDVKPGNIMASRTKSKLIDFGAGRVMGEQHPYTPSGVCVGTTHALAPEYLRFDTYSPKSDTFSFSLMAYRMLTGHEPYGGTENGFLYYDLPLFRPEKLDRYTGIKDLIVRGMNTTISQRPEMKEIADALTEQTAKYRRQPSEALSTPSLVSL